MDAKKKQEIDSKIAVKFKAKSPFSHKKIPSREFIQTLPRHGVGLSKAFCERLKREKRFQLLYDKAKAQDILIIPNPENRKLGPTENLIYLVCSVHGEAGYLKLKDFIEEFIEYAGNNPTKDARAFVV